MRCRHAWFAAAVGFALGGCSVTPPEPWEKELLARPAMSLEGNVLERRFRQQIYDSRENSSRGNGIGGGGCGCN